MQQEQELMISSVDMNALLGILCRTLGRSISMTELGELLQLIGSFIDETEQEDKGGQEQA